MDLDKEIDTSQITAGESEATNNMGDESVDLQSQLQVINLGYIGADSNIFELASTYVDFSFLPLFQDYKTKSQGANAQGSDQN